MHSLYLCIPYIHIGSEEEAPVEYVIVEEENLQELPPEDEGQAFEPLSECPNHRPSTFHQGKPQSIINFLSFLQNSLNYIIFLWCIRLIGVG
jgi:hypothetical protein